MSQTDISKHVEKGPENYEKSKTRKNNRRNSENVIFAKKTELMLRRVKRVKFEELYCFMKPWLQKTSFTYFWL